MLVEEATSLVILSRAYQKSHLSLAKFDGHHVVFGADFVLAFGGHNVFVQALHDTPVCKRMDTRAVKTPPNERGIDGRMCKPIKIVSTMR